MARQGLKRKKGGEDKGASAALMRPASELNERRIEPSDLEGVVKRKREKEERIASIKAGREGREFCAKAALKQKKTGGLSNREHQRRKAVPVGVHRAKTKARMANGKRKGGSKNFQGKKAWKK
eukprot:TRINITY_DN5589_c1_g3_i2.p2 TRINITY_DN5589_c1_g3~~TRINITY_DN5589_c1_g3_i2.p2  ORF type:complete len:123 (-),score=32.76 TRINITY_DN5589_c1_g3_i2:123-491(-)